MRFIVPIVILAVFGGFSVEVILTHGYFGFVTLALREPWAMQMLIDLCLALGIAGSWVVRDAKAYGINPWPYVIASVPLGSLGLMPYFVHRELLRRRTPVTSPT